MFQMKGVVPPMITPFKENGDVDYEGLVVLVNFLKDKVDGLFITGSYGSGALMTVEEREKVTEVVMETVADAIPVIVHVGSTNNRTSVRLVEHARSLNVAAVSAVGPYYYKHNADSICLFYSDLVKAAGDIPVYAYNNPGFQGYEMELSLLKRLKDEAGVRGIKDATFDIIKHASYIRTLKDENFDIASGTEAIWLQSNIMGTQAFIPGLGNVFPEICKEMWLKSDEGKYEECRNLQFKINQVRDVMYLAKSTQLAIYAMLEIRGVLKCYPRAPFIPASEEEKDAIRMKLVEMGLL